MSTRREINSQNRATKRASRPNGSSIGPWREGKWEGSSCACAWDQVVSPFGPRCFLGSEADGGFLEVFGPFDRCPNSDRSSGPSDLFGRQWEFRFQDWVPTPSRPLIGRERVELVVGRDEEAALHHDGTGVLSDVEHGFRDRTTSEDHFAGVAVKSEKAVVTMGDPSPMTLADHATEMVGGAVALILRAA